MTDIRRTLLWVIFTMSLVLLYDAWNRHTGQPTLFGSSPPALVAPSATGPTPAPATTATVPGATTVPAAAVNSGVGTANAVPGAVGANPAAVAAGEQVTVTTDAVKATFDSLGGTLVRLELLKYRDAADTGRDVLLFDRSPARLYLAQSGLVTTQAGVKLPNHLTPMTLQPGERSLAEGARTLSLRYESAAIDGHRLLKTYTFTRGSYVIDVKNEFVNQGSTALSPQLYLQLTRDGNAPEGESHFYFTFTGPAMYTEANKFHKLAFKDIEKGKADHDKQADNGWVAMVQHYFASAWVVPTPGPA